MVNSSPGIAAPTQDKRKQEQDLWNFKTKLIIIALLIVMFILGLIIGATLW